MIFKKKFFEILKKFFLIFFTFSEAPQKIHTTGKKNMKIHQLEQILENFSKCPHDSPFWFTVPPPWGVFCSFPYDHYMFSIQYNNSPTISFPKEIGLKLNFFFIFQRFLFIITFSKFIEKISSHHFERKNIYFVFQGYFQFDDWLGTLRTWKDSLWNTLF